MSRSPLLALIGFLLIAATPLAFAQAEPYSSPMYQPRDFQVDGSIQARVEAAIDTSVGLEANRIDVEVRRGHVYLTGKVREAETRARAHAVASEVPGVQGVSVKKLFVSRW